MTSPYQDWHDKKLTAILSRINGAIASPISLRWNDPPRDSMYAGRLVCTVSADGKALSVYMNPDTMRKRLEMFAKIIGA